MLAEDLGFFPKTLGHHGRVLTRGSQIKSASWEAHSVALLIDGGWRRQASGAESREETFIENSPSPGEVWSSG